MAVWCSLLRQGGILAWTHCCQEAKALHAHIPKNLTHTCHRPPQKPCQCVLHAPRPSWFLQRLFFFFFSPTSPPYFPLVCIMQPSSWEAFSSFTPILPELRPQYRKKAQEYGSVKWLTTFLIPTYNHWDRYCSLNRLRPKRSLRALTVEHRAAMTTTYVGHIEINHIHGKRQSRPLFFII